MRRIFLNDEHQAFFDANGYVKVPFIRAGEIDAYRQQIMALSPTDNFNAFQKNLIHPQDYHCTFLDADKNYRLKTFDIISEFFASACASLLDNYKIVQGNVFIKPPHKGYVAPHQNLTIVNEEKYTSLSFWCPALNTNADNGTMVIVPNSHKKFMKYRTTNISWPLLDYFKDYNSPFLETINVNKGELLIIDDSLIHGTTNNTTGDARFVFHAMLAPQEADIVFCDIDHQNNKVKIYEAPPLFWQLYLPGSQPDNLTLKEEVDYTDRKLTPEEFKLELYEKV